MTRSRRRRGIRENLRRMSENILGIDGRERPFGFASEDVVIEFSAIVIDGEFDIVVERDLDERSADRFIIGIVELGDKGMSKSSIGSDSLGWIKHKTSANEVDSFR
jgi:hypothetical protein